MSSPAGSNSPAALPIAAVATAPGRGGIGVVRVSGPALAPVVQALCGGPLEPRRATYLPFLDADGTAIDHGIAIHFPAPHSYTGEDVLELQGHGGPVVLQLLLSRCLQACRELGMRLAEPGEFTRRAFLNDKLDLAQAEAVSDLIEASTEIAARSAARSLEGEFSRLIGALADSLTRLRILTEATLDFPEEEIDFLERADAAGQLARIRARLGEVLAQARQGALLREGLTVVLAGRPNVGKSSLLNALAGAELAIVTPIAGTTRDRLQQTIQIEGVPLNIVDTAGLRGAGETADEVERIGIERSWEAIAKADVVLHLHDARGEGEETGAVGAAASPEGEASGARDAAAAVGAEIAARLRPGIPALAVINKIDTLADPRPGVDAAGAVRISAKTGEGIPALRQRLLDIAGWHSGQEGVFIARERHLQALRQAGAHLAEAGAHLSAAQHIELFAEELRLAQGQLGAITGALHSDDLLGLIFSRFCIGK
ncbi:MAG: tRNA uridine-5-carboxymethylaminomethyl(34) synthesis GTPase MnmE [Candidatus Protistobacter heckmanni]|nr:tRNA uridine-5-carboxymethylaminomethyl(34) synthesis GTPase MnmE [Candidatus Protistobacter heckmanni]